MNRKSFLAELKSLLSFLDGDERSAVLRQYEEMFDAAGASGEEELIKSLGSPVRQVLRIERDFRSGTLVLNREEPSSPEAAPAEEAAAFEMPETPEVQPEPVIPIGETAPVEEAIVPVEDTAIMVPPVPAIIPIPEIAPEETAAEPAPPEEEFFEEPAPVAPEEPIVPPTAEPVPETPMFTVPWDGGEPVYMSEPVPEPEPEVIPAAPEEDMFLLHMSAAPVEVTETEELPPEPVPEAPADPAEEASDIAPAPEKTSPGAGRVFGAVLITLPMIVLGAVGFAVSLALGALAMALGVACGVGAAYCGGYVFGGTITFVPDILLLGGTMLLCTGLALLFLWLGIWLAIRGIALTVQLIGSAYRGVLGKGDKSHG